MYDGDAYSLMADYNAWLPALYSEAGTGARCRFARSTGTAASQGFRTAHSFQTGRAASDVPHRPRLPSYPADRPPDLYGSLSALLGISHHMRS